MNEAWAKIKTNRMILIMNVIICVALTAGYVSDFTRGRKTLFFVATIIIIMAVQLIINIVVFRKNSTSEKFRFFSIVGIFVIYSFPLFSSTSSFTYVYAFPMLVLYVLYFDLTLLKIMGVVLFILNILKVVYQIYHGFTSSVDVSSYIVQVACIVIFSGGLYFLTDLTLKLNNERVEKILESKEDISELARKAEDASKAEAELLERIAAVIPSFVVASKQIADGAQALAQGTTEQAASVDELSAAVVEINRMAIENSQLTLTTQEESLESKRLIGACTEQVRSMLDAMQIIDEKSKIISKTTKVIDDIAFQTNILALNAAVEAARAGQHGKGFAVVAEEVRNLASKSADAAKETSILLESSSLAVEEGNMIAEKVSGSLQSVVEISDATAEHIARVQSLSANQREAINQIDSNIEMMSNVIQQTSATAEESAASSEEMSGKADYLGDLIDDYRNNKIL